MIVKALLLAAGYGTRLRPLTDNTPKCLVPIDGRALLDIWLERLSSAGVGPFLVNTHYLSKKVRDHIKSSIYKKIVTVTYEAQLLGTAGTVISQIAFFEGQDGLLIHADNYCLADFDQFLKAHYSRPKNCLMTMMTFRTDTPSTCGILELDKHGVVIGLHEKVKNPPGNLANGAIYILSAELLHILTTEWRDAKDFSTDVLSRLIGRIYTYETNEFFMDIGTPESYKQANNFLRNED